MTALAAAAADRRGGGGGSCAPVGAETTEALGGSVSVDDSAPTLATTLAADRAVAGGRACVVACRGGASRLCQPDGGTPGGGRGGAATG